MPLPNIGFEEIFWAIVCPVLCGVGCAIWERFRLAPRKFPALIPSLITPLCFFFFLLLSSALFSAPAPSRLCLNELIFVVTLLFVLGFFPSTLSFRGTQHLLKKRFPSNQRGPEPPNTE